MGTRRRARALTCFYQALLVLVWFRKGEDKTTLGVGFGVSRATAYRYVAEAVRVLAAQTPTLHDALTQVAADGWSHVILDGKLFDTDRLAETTTSVKGKTIDAWYSGKHRDFGANIQAVMRPDGLPVWTSSAMPGHLHDLACAQQLDITGALYWAASALDLPTLADSGYEGAGQGIHTPYKQPADGRRLAVDNRTYNAALRSMRCLGERGFAILTRPLAHTRPQHRQPTTGRRHRPRRSPSHPFRIPIPTGFMLRSRHSRPFFVQTAS
ncbi:transposase family protein [Micromonospora sp. NPDC000668]|uniref:transposase family protein n=1 Tax=Micromonospora sp. NPDC000668 TaxID=3364219 RepID=UPI0036D1F27D